MLSLDSFFSGGANERNLSLLSNFLTACLFSLEWAMLALVGVTTGLKTSLIESDC
jgi:hypothetical protein